MFLHPQNRLFDREQSVTISSQTIGEDFESTRKSERADFADVSGRH